MNKIYYNSQKKKNILKPCDPLPICVNINMEQQKKEKMSSKCQIDGSLFCMPTWNLKHIY